MLFSCLNPKCEKFIVTKEKGEGYAENQTCYFRKEYISKDDFQKQLNIMCEKCLNKGE